MTTIYESLIREALAYESQAFDDDTEVNGADLVDWFAHWRQRAKSAIQLTPAQDLSPSKPCDEEAKRFRIYYEHCGQRWEDTWSCACNDECPVCSAEIEPYDYEELSLGKD